MYNQGRQEYNTPNKKANWIGHILRWFFLRKHVTEGMTEGMESEDPMEKKIYWNFREYALDRTLETRFGRG